MELEYPQGHSPGRCGSPPQRGAFDTMIANKHEAIYERNIEAIKAMLAGSGSARPYAIYLGNWMTDMSQIYDPSVATRILGALSRPKLFKAILETFDEAIVTLYHLDNFTEEALAPTAVDLELGKIKVSRIPESLQLGSDEHRLAAATLRETVPQLVSLRKDLHDGLDALTRLPANPGAVEEVMNFLHTLVMAMCLLKFGMNPLDEDHYIPPGELLPLFDNHFGTYKPYQHLDRHLSYVLVAGRDDAEKIDQDYPCLVAFEALRGEPHGMKDYLRGGVEIAAQFLNQLTLGDASAMTNDDLVKLGHSLHAIEDFFAHSNFIERLVAVGPGSDGQWLDGLSLAELGKLRTSNVCLTALSCPNRKKPAKEFEHRAGGFAWEPHLVTGYFTGADAWLSFYNLVADKVLSIFNDQMKDGRTLSVLDMFEQVLVTEPAKQLESLNEVADKMTRLSREHRIFVEDRDIRRLLQRSFPNAPEEAVEILRRLANSLIGVMIAISLGKSLWEATETIRNWIKVIKTVIQIVRIVFSARRKLVYLMRALMPILSWLYEKFFDELAMQVLASLTDSLLSRLKTEMMDAPQVCSHSSIAKDDRLGQNGFYQKAENFAVAVDQLVFGNLLRSAPIGTTSEEIIRWDATLLEIFKDPLRVYGGETPTLGMSPGLTRQMVSHAELDGVVRAGARLSTKVWVSYVAEVLSYNPHLMLNRNNSFVFRAGASVQEIILPVNAYPTSRGWRVNATAPPFADWRSEIYFSGVADLEACLSRASREQVKQAIAQTAERGRKILGEFQDITKCLYPAAFPNDDTEKVEWGYTGF